MLFRTIEVKTGFRAIHLHDGAVRRVYGPGRHTIWTLSGLHDVQFIDLAADLSPLTQTDPVPEDLDGAMIITVEAHERVVIVLRGLVRQILSPGRYRWWKAAGEPTLQRFDVREQPAALPASDVLPASAPSFKLHTLAEHGLLSRDGRPFATVPPGRYRIWEGSPWTLAALPKAMTAYNEAADADPPAGMQVHAVGVHERAVAFWHGVLLHVLNPGRYRWWEVLGPIEILRFDIREEPAALASDDPLPAGSRAGAWDEAASVEGLPLVLVRDGQPFKALPPGRYRTWQGGRWSLKPVPMSLQLLDIAPQDLLSAIRCPCASSPPRSCGSRSRSPCCASPTGRTRSTWPCSSGSAR